jgi:hypothetical protein
VLVLIVDLHVRDTSELLHRGFERLDDVVGSAVGLAVASEVDVESTVRELDAPVAHEAIPHGDQPAPLFVGVRPLEILVECCSDRVR